MFGATGFLRLLMKTQLCYRAVGVSGAGSAKAVLTGYLYNGDADAVITGLQATASSGVLVFNESVAVTGLCRLQAVGAVLSRFTSQSGHNFLKIGCSPASMPMTSQREQAGSLLGGFGFEREPFATQRMTVSWISFSGLGCPSLLAATGSVGGNSQY